MPSSIRSFRHAGWCLAPLLLVACAGAPERAAAPPAAVASAPAHDNLNAVLWMQTAAEYRAVMLGSFNLATDQLDAALADPDWDALPPDERAAHPLDGQPPAVIVDADETMIDNSAFQARMIAEGVDYSLPRWTAWSNERRARALPGALEFARHAAANGVIVLFVTNRKTPAELDATADNLEALGFPVAADRSNLMLAGDVRGPGREKGARRAWIAERYRVLLMLGDNLGDFVDGIETGLAERQALVDRHRDWWGRRWIMLPNPSYGSWEGALLHDCPAAAAGDPQACRRAALRHD